jgi:hypothetical protein
MTTYTLTSPLVIGPRLMPALIFGLDTDTYGTISAEIDSYDGERYVLRYVIDTSGETYEAADIRTGVTMPTDDDGALSMTLRSLFGALLAYLDNEAVRYSIWMRSGDAQPSEGWSFSEGVAEWAYVHAEGIGEARMEIEGGDY